MNSKRTWLIALLVLAAMTAGVFSLGPRPTFAAAGATKTDDLGVSHNVAPSTSFHWTVSVTGASGQFTDVSDTLPTGFTLTAASSNNVPVACGAITGGNHVECDGTASVDPVVITLTATSSATCGDATNTASVSIGLGILGPSDTVHVTGCAPTGLTDVKTHSPAGTVTEGTGFSWISTISTTNGNGASLAFSDTVPAGFTIGTITPSITSTPACGAVGQLVSCTFPNVTGSHTGGTAITVTINVTAPAVCTIFNNTSTVTPTPGTAVTSVADSVTLTGCPSPTVTKTDNVTGVVSVSGSFNWVLNFNNVASQAITVQDTLPSGFTATVANSSDAGVTCSVVTNVVSCNGSPAANSFTVTIPTTAPATCQQVTNTASVTVGIGVLAPSDQMTVTGCAPTGLAVSKTHANPAGNITISTGFDWISTITATAGNGSNFVFTDTVPAGFTVGTITPSITSTPACGAVGQLVTCTFPNRTGVQNFTVTIHVTAPATCGTVTNTSTVTPTPGTAVSSTGDSVTTTGCPTPGVTKTDDLATPGHANAGDNFHWLLNFSNVSGTAITLHDALPAGFPLGTVTVTPPNAGLSCTSTVATNSIDCLATPATMNTIQISIATSAPNNCQVFTNTASVTLGVSATGATDTVTVANCFLQWTKTDDTAHNVNAGGSFNWTLMVAGTQGLETELADTLPPGFTLNSFTLTPPTAATCTQPTTTSVDCATGSATVNSITLVVNVTAPNDCKTFTNQGVFTINLGPVFANDNVTVHNCTTHESKTDDTSHLVNAGGTFHWTLAADGMDTQQTEFADTLPTGFTLNSFTVTPSGALTCTQTANTIDCLTAAATANAISVALNVTAPSVCQQYTNQGIFTINLATMFSMDSVTVQNCGVTPTTGTFTVHKHFSDANASTVSFHVTCTGGTAPADQTATGTPDVPAVFTITGITGSASCTATEPTVPAGYTADVSGCLNVAIAAGSGGSCIISNTVIPPNSGTFTVHKHFSDANASTVSFHVTCTNGTAPADQTATGNPDVPAVFTITAISGTASCTATEPTVPAGYTVNATGCVNIAVTPVSGGSCIITNTANATPPPTVNPPALLKSFGSSTVAVGGSTTVSFKLTNPNASALTNVSFTDNLAPSGFKVSTPNGLVNGCGGTVTAVANTTSITVSGVTLAASSNCTITVGVTAVTQGTQTNVTSAVTSNEASGPGAAGTATINVTAAPPSNPCAGIPVVNGNQLCPPPGNTLPPVPNGNHLGTAGGSPDAITPASSQASAPQAAPSQVSQQASGTSGGHGGN